MKDPRWFVGRDGNQFQHASVAVGSDDQQAFLALILVLDQSDGVGPGVGDVDVVDSVLPCRALDLQPSMMP